MLQYGRCYLLNINRGGFYKQYALFVGLYLAFPEVQRFHAIQDIDAGAELTAYQNFANGSGFVPVFCGNV